MTDPRTLPLDRSSSQSPSRPSPRSRSRRPPISFPNIVLLGLNQGFNVFPNSWRVDATGTTGGWHVTVGATSLSDGAGHTIPRFKIRMRATGIVVISDDSNGPVTTQSTFADFPNTFQIVSAAAGDGNLQPQFRAVVFANTFAGAYSAIVTVDLIAGP